MVPSTVLLRRIQGSPDKGGVTVPETSESVRSPFRTEWVKVQTSYLPTPDRIPPLPLPDRGCTPQPDRVLLSQHPMRYGPSLSPS